MAILIVMFNYQRVVSLLLAPAIQSDRGLDSIPDIWKMFGLAAETPEAKFPEMKQPTNSPPK